MHSELINFIATLRWQDGLDIAINSFILFRLYVLFRGTHTFRVMLVIAGLWFFQRLAHSLDLIVTSWVIQGITAALAIIIIVVFRSEIRSVFQTRSIGAFLWEFSPRKVPTSIDILPDTIFDLAAGRIGALLVFGRRDDISEITKGGIAWQGLISDAMIKSIFFKNNPVHDGAAVIQGDHVIAVSCLLPLTMQKKLPAYFGTRHRAALGMSEVSDALIVMVSEERGKVLVCKESQYQGIRKKEDLKRILMEHTSGKTPVKHFYEHETVRLVFAALLSLVLVSFLWFNITRGQNILITQEVPIKYINQRSGMKIFDTSTDFVSLHLSGPAPLIKHMQPAEVQIAVDLADAVIGHNKLSIFPKEVLLPPGIALERMNPNNIDVILDIFNTKSVPIQVDWTGTLPEDKLLTRRLLDPEVIKVKGPSLKLKELFTLYTQPVLLNGLKSSGHITAGLALPSFLELLPGQKDTVTITYLLEDRTQP